MSCCKHVATTILMVRGGLHATFIILFEDDSQDQLELLSNADWNRPERSLFAKCTRG